MFDWLSWFTHMENTKPFVLVIFSITFVFILVYVFTNRNRSDRLESYKNIPFQEDNGDGQSKDIKDE
ncbi:MAG: cbb3-type cytochrome c oxidase subunit 3 [Woeseiaceae bacterium]